MKINRCKSVLPVRLPVVLVKTSFSFQTETFSEEIQENDTENSEYAD